jgi:putative phosphoribosyl transferase
MKKLKPFKDRIQAGKLLAERLTSYARRADVIVLALPRGGVPVGFAIAKKLKVALDILSVRKLGLPGHEEYAIGAIASDGVCILQTEILDAFEIPPSVIETLTQRKLHESERQEKLYRAGRSSLQLQNRIVILVDDGLATGSTMQVAIHVVHNSTPAKVIVAIPVAAPETCDKLRSEVNEMICLRRPEPFYAVGLYDENFEQVTDEEVKKFLEEAEKN